MIKGILDINDLFVSPVVLGLIIILALLVRKRHTKAIPQTKKYFLPALYLRILGCFLSALMYQYYYNGGDTFTYYRGSIAFWNMFWDDPLLMVKTMLTSSGSLDESMKQYFIETFSSSYLNANSTLFVMKTGGLLGLFTFQSYVSIGIILAFLSFFGSWKLYEVFLSEYPNLYKPIAFACLFIPSVFFWGSAGLMKDTIIMAALGYTVWGVYFGIISKRKKGRAFLYLILGGYTLLMVKTYVAFSIFPCLLLWIFLKKKSHIKNRVLRYLSTIPFLILGTILGTLLFQILMSGGESKYHPENVIKYAREAQGWHKYVTEVSGGVGYDFGEYENSLFGIVKLIPKAINVTLFRPYIWEAKKLILIPSFIESFLTFLITLYVLLKVGVLKSLRAIFKDSTLLFCFSFSLLFAFAIGFSTYNFGALVRYKIPCLPFYFVGLSILYSKRIKNLRPH